MEHKTSQRFSSINPLVIAPKTKHGGKRKGAGRKAKEPTVTKRIPIGILDKVEAMIKKHKSKPFHG